MLTAHRTGRDGIRQLFSGALQWRIGWSHWALAAGALPTATAAVAAATGTLTAPHHSWLVTIGTYLFFTFVFGTLLLNLWEETAWQGLVQRHLTRRHGLLGGALLTAVPFAALHLPLQLAGTTARQAVINSAQLFALAPALC